jgi:lipoprotein-anchoring transpeptidase ErfK/SrfK
MILRLFFPVFASGLIALAGSAAAQSQMPGAYPAGPAAPAQENTAAVPAYPPPVVIGPGPGAAEASAPPAYENQPRASEARAAEPQFQPQPPQPRGLSAIPIFGPLLSPLDNSGPAASPRSANQFGSRDGIENQPVGAIPQNDSAGAMRPPGDVSGSRATTLAALPPEDQPEVETKELPPHLKRQFVDYVTREPVGTLVIDTPNTYLYLVLANGKAMRYGIGVGREGFTWAGAERVSRMAEWPDWHPPAEMIERQPYLPRFMAGGEGNPLGARALYLGKTLYRIHGTNQPSTIGTFVSSGCIRLVNEDIADLYSRVTVGTRVVVLPGGRPPAPAPAAAQNVPVDAPRVR